jgi:N-acetyl-alpha-D-muramate 1-phosphate uridylyltransferase
MPKIEMRQMPLMLFAAGFGTRMGALTERWPKPLIEVGGKALIDHALEVADGAAIGRTVVNLHYRGDQIRQHLRHRSDIRFSEEAPKILDTGGGLRHAGRLLGGKTALTLNTDAIWTGRNPLQQLIDGWQPEAMDCLLLLLPADLATGHTGKPDFSLGSDGRIQRGTGKETHVYLGAQVVKVDGLDTITEPAFSLNTVWDQMIRGGRAFGIEHDGGWCDVGYPSAIALAEEMLSQDQSS